MTVEAEKSRESLEAENASLKLKYTRCLGQLIAIIKSLRDCGLDGFADTLQEELEKTIGL